VADPKRNTPHHPPGALAFAEEGSSRHLQEDSDRNLLVLTNEKMHPQSTMSGGGGFFVKKKCVFF